MQRLQLAIRRIVTMYAALLAAAYIVGLKWTRSGLTPRRIPVPKHPRDARFSATRILQSQLLARWRRYGDVRVQRCGQCTKSCCAALDFERRQVSDRRSVICGA